MQEIKDAQYNINLKWFEFDTGDAGKICINFERVRSIKYTDPSSLTILIEFLVGSETIAYVDAEEALVAYNKMKHILKVINVDKLSPQNS